MSFLIKVIIMNVSLFVIFVAIIELVDDHADVLWLKLLEKYDALCDKVDQYFSEPSENSDYDLIKDWPIEYDPNPDPGEKPKEGQ